MVEEEKEPAPGNEEAAETQPVEWRTGPAPKSKVRRSEGMNEVTLAFLIVGALLVAVLVAAVIIALFVAGDSETLQTRAASPASTGSTASVVSTTTVAPATSSTSITTSSTTSEVPAVTPAPTSAPSPLRGIGLTRAEWESVHPAAAEHSAGSAYGPLLSGGQPTYGVVYGRNIIAGYTRHFERTVSVEQARSRMISEELPSDSRRLTSRNDGVCLVEVYGSPTFAAQNDGAEIELSIENDAPDYRTASLALIAEGDRRTC